MYKNSGWGRGVLDVRPRKCALYVASVHFEEGDPHLYSVMELVFCRFYEFLLVVFVGKFSVFYPIANLT